MAYNAVRVLLPEHFELFLYLVLPVVTFKYINNMLMLLRLDLLTLDIIYWLSAIIDENLFCTTFQFFKIVPLCLCFYQLFKGLNNPYFFQFHSSLLSSIRAAASVLKNLPRETGFLSCYHWHSCWVGTWLSMLSYACSHKPLSSVSLSIKSFMNELQSFHPQVVLSFCSGKELGLPKFISTIIMRWEGGDQHIFAFHYLELQVKRCMGSFLPAHRYTDGPCLSPPHFLSCCVPGNWL